jgi:hypothetical protein
VINFLPGTTNLDRRGGWEGVMKGREWNEETGGRKKEGKKEGTEITGGKIRKKNEGRVRIVLHNASKYWAAGGVLGVDVHRPE